MKNKCYKHTCITQAEVKAYMEDTFESEEAAQAFEDKIEKCDHCLELLESMQIGLMAEKLLAKDDELNSKVTEVLTKPRPGRSLVASFYWRIGIAASILLLIGIVWVLRFPPKQVVIRDKSNPLSKNGQDTIPHKQMPDLVIDTAKKIQKDTITKPPIKTPPKAIVKEPVVPPTPEKQMAFENNQLKVAILESALTNANYMGENLEVMAPRLRQVIQGPVVRFRLNYERDSVLFVSIYDSTKIAAPVREKMLLKAAKKFPQLFEKNLPDLPPATYYWRVYNAANRALFIGKFRKTH